MPPLLQGMTRFMWFRVGRLPWWAFPLVVYFIVLGVLLFLFVQLLGGVTSLGSP